MSRIEKDCLGQMGVPGLTFTTESRPFASWEYRAF